VSVARLVR